MKYTEIDMIDFADWISDNYDRINDKWVKKELYKYNPDNHKDTESLFKYWSDNIKPNQ